MKILIYGAGVIGGNLAHYLKKQHDITLLVRESSLQKYTDEGIVIKHKFKRRKLRDHYKLITRLEENDIYDAIILPLRFSQLGDVMHDLSQNKSKLLLFIGNNMETEKITFQDKEILFGFFHAAGYRHDVYIDSICMKKITIGQACGDGKKDALIHELFDQTGIKITIENHMDAWLKTHATSILPLVFACYYADGDLRKLSKDKEYSYKIIQAVKEGYDVLRALDIEILPKGEYETTANKQGYCAWLYRFMFSNWIGQVSICDHAMHARDEMTQLLQAFLWLKSQAQIETPIFDELREKAKM